MTIADVTEQIQEDIRTYMDGQDEDIIDQLCQIVVDNMKKLKKD